MKVLVSLLIVLGFGASGKEKKKTVSECVRDLNRAVFGLGDKKYQAICQKYSQESIECAIENYRGRSLGRTFEDAIQDCDRIDSEI